MSSDKAKLKNHALLVQKIQGSNYLGRRIRLSAYLRADNVQGWAGIWVRVDDQKGRVLSFENMMETPLRGDSPWKKYSIEVDVSEAAEEIHFGMLLAGSGTVAVDDFSLEALGPERRREELKQRIRSLPKEPQNLDFEK